VSNEGCKEKEGRDVLHGKRRIASAAV
jgi:hypothetical protein